MSSKPSSFGNRALSNAKRAKNDEFYTQWTDIEREMNAYLEYDPDVFREQCGRGLLPADFVRNGQPWLQQGEIAEARAGYGSGGRQERR